MHKSGGVGGCKHDKHKHKHKHLSTLSSPIGFCGQWCVIVIFCYVAMFSLTRRRPMIHKDAKASCLNSFVTSSLSSGPKACLSSLTSSFSTSRHPHRQLGQGQSNHIHPSHRQLHRPHTPRRELQPALRRQYTPAVGSRFMTNFASVCIPVFDEPDVLRSFSCSNRGFVWRVEGYLHIGQLQWFKDSLSGIRVPRSYSVIRSSIHDHSSISIPAWMSWGNGCQLRVKVRWTETIDFAYMVRTCVILVRYTAMCMQSRRLATKCPSLLI
jgi:hypothetical protein